MAAGCHRKPALRQKPLAQHRPHSLDCDCCHSLYGRLCPERLAAGRAGGGHLRLDRPDGAVEMGDGDAVGHCCGRALFGDAGPAHGDTGLALASVRAGLEPCPEHCAIPSAFCLYDPGGCVHRRWPQGGGHRDHHLFRPADDPHDAAGSEESPRGGDRSRQDGRIDPLATSDPGAHPYGTQRNPDRGQSGDHAMSGHGGAGQFHRHAGTGAKAAATAAGAEDRPVGRDRRDDRSLGCDAGPAVQGLGAALARACRTKPILVQAQPACGDLGGPVCTWLPAGAFRALFS